MANTFLSKKIIIPAIIFFGGLLIASGILTLSSFTFVKLSIASQSPQWTQETGAGVSVPACASASGNGSCSGAQAFINVSWSKPGCNSAEPYFDGAHYGFHPCTSSINVPVADGSCHSFGVSINGFGSHTDGTACAPVCASSPTPPPPPGQSPPPPPRGQSPPPPPRGQSPPPSPPPGLPSGCGPGTLNDTCPPGPVAATILVNGSHATQTVSTGSIVTVSWSSSNASGCTVQPFGAQTTSGSQRDGPLNPPQGYVVYSIFCSNSVNSADDNVTVFVTPPPPPPPGDFNLSLGGSVACNSVPLNWTSSLDAQAYRILRGNPRVDISPYQPYTFLNFTDTTVSQGTTYQYQIEAYNSGGTKRSNALNVNTPNCPPTLNFSGNPTTLFQGQSTTLTWSTAYTTSCVASGAWSGSKPVNGSEIIIPNPPPSVTYNLQCSGPGGSTAVQPVTINIIPLALPEWREIIPR